MSIINRIVVVALLALGMVGTVALPAQAIPVNGCDQTASYTARPDGNDLTFQTNFEGSGAFYTPIRRSGGCRHVMVENLGMWNALDGVLRCIQGKVRTYNENGTIRVNGSWVQYNSLLEIHDLRNTIEDQRRYRIYTRACTPSWRTWDRPIGIRIYAQ